MAESSQHGRPPVLQYGHPSDKKKRSAKLPVGSRKRRAEENPFSPETEFRTGGSGDAGRFVISNRLAGRYSLAANSTGRAAVSRALNRLTTAEVAEDHDSESSFTRRVVVIEADPAEIEAKRAAMPEDVLIEPEILHWPDLVGPRDLQPTRHRYAQAAQAGSVSEFLLTVTGGGKPLANAQVVLYVRGWGGISRELKASTGTGGLCRFPVPVGYEPAAAVIIPAGGFWTMVARGAALGGVIECPPLPTDGPLGWWHRVLGLRTFDEGLGAGVRIGVIDTGTGPHPSLGHVTLGGAFVDSVFTPGTATFDVDSHGTHVAGIIGARPGAAGEYAGIAPGCDLTAVRVFRGADAGASNADIALGIDALVQRHSVHAINLSLGAARPSIIVHDAIIDALERGTVSVCAAGNDGAEVRFPAAFPECITVTALGWAGWGPPGSMSAARLPDHPDKFGLENLFLANFSCFGPQVACTAPGVGIIAPISGPNGGAPFGAMDGTSMASPSACGALAVLLSRHMTYLQMPEDGNRTEAARQILTASLRDIGLKSIYGGRGVAFLGNVVV